MPQERKEFDGIMRRLINKRTLLKGSAIYAASAVGSIATRFLINGEADNLIDGVKTNSGIFIPLYENHLRGIENDHIPRDINIFFTEWGKNANSQTPVETLKSILTLDRERLSRLAGQQTEIMPGDVEIGWKNYLGNNALSLTEMVSGWYFYKYLNKKAGDMEKNTRRVFLKTAAKLSLIWPLAPVITTLPAAAVSSQDNMALRKVAARLNTFPANTHPEDIIIFFRSLIMADKLLTVADEFNERTGRKPKIAFNVGVGHSNVEDFLKLGGDFCRKLILAHPTLFLSEVVKKNGGVTNFASSRLFKLPEDLNYNASIPNSGSPLGETTERFVVDRKLEQGLRNKGFE